MAENRDRPTFSSDYGRMVAVTNPNSSRYHLLLGALERLKKETAGRNRDFIEIQTVSGDHPQNTAHIRSQLWPGDRVVSMGGDGLGRDAFNAIAGNPDLNQWPLLEVALGFYPGGGFNDNSVIYGHDRGLTHFLTSRSVTLTDLTPLQITNNGNHLWYSPLYASFGPTAETADVLNSGKVRETIRHTPAMLKKAYGAFVLARSFMENGLNYRLPPFTHNGAVHTDIGSIMVHNAPVMAAVLRSNEAWHRDPERFLTSFIPASTRDYADYFARGLINTFGGARTQVLLPGTPVTELNLDFHDQEAWLQSEGEATRQRLGQVAISKPLAATVPIVDVRRHIASEEDKSFY